MSVLGKLFRYSWYKELWNIKVRVDFVFKFCNIITEIVLKKPYFHFLGVTSSIHDFIIERKGKKGTLPQNHDSLVWLELQYFNKNRRMSNMSLFFNYKTRRKRTFMSNMSVFYIIDSAKKLPRSLRCLITLLRLSVTSHLEIGFDTVQKAA